MTLGHSRGFVLSRRERGEADLVLELILEDGSFQRAIAPWGARSSRRYAAGLSAFTLYRFTFGRARGAGFVRVDEAAVDRAWPTLLADLRRTAAAGVLCAITRESVREEAPAIGMFERLAQGFAALADADAARAGAVMVWFTMAALAASGEAIVLDSCVRCGKSAPDGASVQLAPMAGGIVCAACGGGPVSLHAADRRALRRVSSGELDVFVPAMLGWVLAMSDWRLGRAADVLRGAVGYWKVPTVGT